MSQARKPLQYGDRVRATEDIRMDDYPFCDVRTGTVGQVVSRYTPEKARSCWNVKILFSGTDYLVMLSYPTTKVEKIEDIFLPVM
jgi:hypothetical protein